MTILSAQAIRFECENKSKHESMIYPFVLNAQVEHGLSYGLSCCGYDIRLAQSITLYPTTLLNLLLGRKAFALGSSVELFNLPKDVAAMVMDKSTHARKGLAVQTTIFEPGWKGYATLELSNHGPKTLRLLAGMPIAQVVFHYLEENTEIPYRGKYQNQESGPQGPRYNSEATGNG